MSKSYYYALWVPQTKKGYPGIIQTTLQPKTLRDTRSVLPLYINANIAQDTYDINLTYKIGCKTAINLIFYYIESDDHGIVIYRLDLEDQQDDFLCDLLRKEMPNALYHYFKSFFHRHIFHDESEDSLLTPYFSKDPINWKNAEVRNTIIARFIKDYEVKFKGALEEYTEYRNSITANLKRKKKIRRMLNLLTILREQIRKTLNERVYCEFLLKSFPKCITAEGKQNLKDTINKVEIISQDLEYLYDKVYTEVGFQFSRGGFWIGGLGSLFGFVSTIWSICLSQESTNELRAGKYAIIECIEINANSLMQEKQCILEEVQVLNNKVDTVNHTIRKIRRSDSEYSSRERDINQKQ